MSDQRTHVTVDPNHPSKVKILIDGPTCSTLNVLARDEARTLAAQIMQHLLETETPWSPCWRSECARGCYYPTACTDARPTETESTTEGDTP